jgi:hypothetical protein
VGFVGFLGRHVFASIVGTTGILLLAIGYAQEADAIMTSFQPWAWQATGAAFFVIAVVMLLFRYDQQQSDRAPVPSVAKEPKAPPPPPTAKQRPSTKPVRSDLPKLSGRTYVGDGIDLDYLTSLCTDKTTHQAQQIVKPFIGKWIRISAKFDDLRMVSSDLAQVSVGPRDVFTLLYFRNDFDKLEMLRPGQDLTVEGRIDKIALFGVELDDCELVG